MTGNHFFTSDEFFSVLADVYFPGAKPRFVRCGDVVARVLVHRGKAISGFWDFPYSVRPAREPGLRPELDVPYLQYVARAETPVGDQGPPGCWPAPFIRWRDFATWEDYEAHSTGRLGARSSSLLRAEKRLARDLGPVTFTPDDDDPLAFDATIRWKSAHYVRSGGGNRYHIEQNVEFYRELRRRGLLTISSLRAGEEIVATKFSHHWAETFIARVTTYNVEVGQYSPGAILLRYVLKQSYEAGDEEFDFLMGRETYKYNYATHIRWLGHVGREPRVDRWRRRGRMQAALLAGRYPVVHQRLRQVEAASGRALHRLGVR